MYQYPSWHFPPMNYKASQNSASRFYKKGIVLTKPPPQKKQKTRTGNSQPNGFKKLRTNSPSSACAQ